MKNMTNMTTICKYKNYDPLESYAKGRSYVGRGAAHMAAPFFYIDNKKPPAVQVVLTDFSVRNI